MSHIILAGIFTSNVPIVTKEVVTTPSPLPIIGAVIVSIIVIVLALAYHHNKLKGFGGFIFGRLSEEKKYRHEEHGVAGVERIIRMMPSKDEYPIRKVYKRHEHSSNPQLDIEYEVNGQPRVALDDEANFIKSQDSKPHKYILEYWGENVTPPAMLQQHDLRSKFMQAQRRIKALEGQLFDKSGGEAQARMRQAEQEHAVRYPTMKSQGRPVDEDKYATTEEQGQ